MASFTFSFRKQFADRVASGEKLQTILQHRKDGRMPRPGDRVLLFTGMRTAYCRRLGASTVTEAFPVHLDLERGDWLFIVNGVRLNFVESEAFAKLDGFRSAVEMIEWFRETYPDDGAFDGFCTRWRAPEQHNEPTK